MLYLGIYCNVGGDPNYIFEKNIKHSRSSQSPTQLLQIIYDYFLDNFDPIYAHFNTEYSSCSENELPLQGRNLVSVGRVRQICTAIYSRRADIIDICTR